MRATPLKPVLWISVLSALPQQHSLRRHRRVHSRLVFHCQQLLRWCSWLLFMLPPQCSHLCDLVM
jgi:hypothetical protein